MKPIDFLAENFPSIPAILGILFFLGALNEVRKREKGQKDYVEGYLWVTIVLAFVFVIGLFETGWVSAP